MAWVRWSQSAGPGDSDPPLWEGNVRGESYCRDCRAGRRQQGEPDWEARCAECPAPRILPENLPAYVAYRRARTQWRMAPMGGRAGLDYAGVQSILPRAERDYQEVTEDSPDLPEWDEGQVWDGLQVIEDTHLEVQQERLDKRDDTRGDQ